MTLRPVAAFLACFATAVATGCGGGEDADPQADRAAEQAVRTTQQTRVDVIRSAGGSGGFDPEAIARAEGPGVVTIFSLVGQGGGEGSGFVVSPRGEILTNAHVVTDGEGSGIRRADRVFVRFRDRNQVEARIVGFDPNADVALLRIDPRGLRLRPLPLGRTTDVAVGEPVAAIGSPFGEEQSVSVGIVSATGRDIRGLTGFRTPNAIQTDAAINQGNSGGPLLDAAGRVIGINAQIRSASGGGDGVGFAIDVDTARRSLTQLRRDGRVRYGFLGIATTSVYPQLAERFDLGTDTGAWVQELSAGGPSADAGVRGPDGDRVRFQAGAFRPGGDVVVAIGGRRIVSDSDVGAALARYVPGDEVAVEVVRDGRRQELSVRLGERPASNDG